MAGRIFPKGGTFYTHTHTHTHASCPATVSTPAGQHPPGSVSGAGTVSHLPSITMQDPAPQHPLANFSFVFFHGLWKKHWSEFLFSSLPHLPAVFDSSPFVKLLFVLQTPAVKFSPVGSTPYLSLIHSDHPSALFCLLGLLYVGQVASSSVRVGTGHTSFNPNCPAPQRCRFPVYPSFSRLWEASPASSSWAVSDTLA